MLNFTAWIIVGNGKAEFSFTRIYHTDGMRYYVSVFDKTRKLISFDMKEMANNEWMIQDSLKLPSWILELEDELSSAIKTAKPKKD